MRSCGGASVEGGDGVGLSFERREHQMGQGGWDSATKMEFRLGGKRKTQRGRRKGGKECIPTATTCGKRVVYQPILRAIVPVSVDQTGFDVSACDPSVHAPLVVNDLQMWRLPH